MTKRQGYQPKNTGELDMSNPPSDFTAITPKVIDIDINKELNEVEITVSLLNVYQFVARMKTLNAIIKTACRALGFKAVIDIRARAEHPLPCREWPEQGPETPAKNRRPAPDVKPDPYTMIKRI